MTQYNSLNVKLPNSKLNKLKSAIKNGNDVILRLSSNMIGNSDDETITIKKFLVIKPLSMLGLTAAASATDAAINKKILGSGSHTTLIISNDDLNNLLEVIKPFQKKNGILLDGITETVKNKVKEQKRGFLSMLLGTLGASLLGDLLTKNLSGRGVIRVG